LKQFGFSKKQRVLKNKEFKTVLDKNIRVSDGILTVFVSSNGLGYSRLGVSIGKFCGNAVVRNRMKRLVRESFRQSQEVIAGGFDYVVMLSTRVGEGVDRKLLSEIIKKMRLEQVKKSFLKLAEKAVWRLE